MLVVMVAEPNLGPKHGGTHRRTPPVSASPKVPQFLQRQQANGTSSCATERRGTWRYTRLQALLRRSGWLLLLLLGLVRVGRRRRSLWLSVLLRGVPLTNTCGSVDEEVAVVLA